MECCSRFVFVSKVPLLSIRVPLSASHTWPHMLLQMWRVLFDRRLAFTDTGMACNVCKQCLCIGKSVFCPSKLTDCSKPHERIGLKHSRHLDIARLVSPRIKAHTLPIVRPIALVLTNESSRLPPSRNPFATSLSAPPRLRTGLRTTAPLRQPYLCLDTRVTPPTPQCLASLPTLKPPKLYSILGPTGLNLNHVLTICS